MPTAADYLRAQRLVPSDLRSKEWARADAWVRERAFFKASVAKAEQLERFRAAESAIASGQMGAGQAREMMRRYLQASGYQAPEGLKGTIKDLSTARRLSVSIDTDVAMARGWAQRQQMLGDITNPGQRLYRARASREPRDWARRWQRAAAAVNYEGVARDGSMIALITSPVWVALSAFGNPYPPYDWGSGMSVMPVSFEDCERAGLVDDKMFEDIESAKRESYNAHVEMTPQVSERALRDALAETLEGIAEWRGDKLILTDPNGSRPYDWGNIGRIISTPNQAGVPLYQAQAFRDWVEDSSVYAPNGSAGLDAREDMIRLIERIMPTSSRYGGTIFRGLKSSTAQERDAKLRTFQDQGFYSARPGFISESWTPKATMADEYGRSNYPIIVRCDNYATRKRIDGLYRHVPASNKSQQHPVQTEGESLFVGGTRFRIKKITQEGNRTYIDVDELR